MKTETVPIASLVLDPANARKHAPKNLEAIKGSLAKFGQQKNIVVDKNNIVVAGNGTLEAARALGRDTISVHRTELEGADAVAYALSDNRTSELAEWDAGVLSKTLESLKTLDFDLGSIGFDEDDLAGLLGDTMTNQEGHDFDDKLGALLASGMRTIQLGYPHATFELVTAALRTCMVEFEAESNSEAVLKLLEMHFGGSLAHPGS